MRRPAGRPLAAVLLAPGDAKCTYGTGAFLLATPARPPSGRATGWWRASPGASARAPPTALTARSTRSASAVRWLARASGVIAVRRRPRRRRRHRSPTPRASPSSPPSPAWRAPLARARRAARSPGSVSSTTRGAPRAGAHRGHRRRGGRRLGPRRRRGPGRPPERLRVDGGLTRSQPPHAGAGRPPAGARSRSTRPRRDRARRRRGARAGLGARRRARPRRPPWCLAGRRDGRAADRAPTRRRPCMAGYGPRSRRIAGRTAAHDEALRRRRRRRRRGRCRRRPRARPPPAAGRARRGRADDVGDGTSKANTAILHTGFDATPGTLESRLVRRGYELLSGLRRRGGHRGRAAGALLVAWDDEEARRPARAGGQGRAQRVPRHPARRRGRALRPRARTSAPGRWAPSRCPARASSDPWSTPLAFATEALDGGVELLLGTEVTGVTPGASSGPRRLRDRAR